jgi:hypothetical protein
MIDALPLLLGPEGYQISRSVRLRSSASAYFNRTPASASNRKTWTWSNWVKRGAINGARRFIAGTNNTGGVAAFYFEFDANERLNIGDYASPSWNWQLTTSAVFRDPSAWYHIAIAFDTTQATSSNRVKIYVNGVQQTALATASYPSLNYDGYLNSATLTTIGDLNGASLFFDGYLTEVNFIDGQALTPSSFGQTDATTGVWSPIKYTGTYGTNGFYLNFSDNTGATATTIGKDYSGNGNNWTPNNISVTAGVTYDSMLDVPTQWADGGNGRGNYAVMNPLDRLDGSIAGGNLDVTTGTVGGSNCRATMAMNSGKFYWEFTPTSNGGIADLGISIFPGSDVKQGTLFTYQADTGNKFSTSGGAVSFGATYTTNDVIGIAYDATNGRIWWAKNGTWQASGDPAAGTNAAFTGITGDAYAYVTDRNVGGVCVVAANFGQRPFSYTPPTGFKALNTLNLPQLTILKGNQYFDIALYNNATVVSGLGFAPDLVWHKSRNQTYQHYLYDKVRGVGAKGLNSSSTAAEGANDSLGIVSFDANGVTYSSDAGLSQTNAVGWFWKEGATQGFDIVTYTGNGTAGATVGHGLGVAPVFIVTKRRDSTSNWWVYSKALNDTGSTGWLYLNTTSSRQVTANAADDPYFKTAPTSSVFSIAGDGINVNTATYVAYLFSEVAGFSRFGSYTGNGSTDGPFVFCGFRPRYVMLKRTDTSGFSWCLHDTARDPENPNDLLLYAEASSAEAAANFVDMLSNGFKIRNLGGGWNASGGTYIFMAFAETPFRNSLAR